MLEPILPEKLSHIIIKRITRLISEQHLEAGDKLPSERELSAALSVSRATVRQAIEELSKQGILVKRQGDGTYLGTRIKEDQVLELLGTTLARSQITPTEILEARFLIECENAKLCARRADDLQIQKLVELLELYSGKKQTLNELNKQLHTEIAIGGGNKALIKMMDSLWEIMDNNMWYFLKRETNVNDKLFEIHNRQHRNIVTAISNRDEQAAYQAMYNHLASIDEEMDTLVNN